MQIENGRYFVNKSWKYLLPATKAYGPVFEAKMSDIWKYAVGIGDAYYPTKGRKCLFILIDTKSFPNKVRNTLDWLKNQLFYIDDYAYDDIETGRKHMIVIEFPEDYHEAYDKFLQGKYSQMYEQDDVFRFFNSEQHLPAFNVLMRTEIGFETFIENTKRSFGTILYRKDLIGAELDFPPEKEKEIFNYKEAENPLYKP